MNGCNYAEIKTIQQHEMMQQSSNCSKLSRPVILLDGIVVTVYSKYNITQPSPLYFASCYFIELWSEGSPSRTPEHMIDADQRTGLYFIKSRKVRCSHKAVCTKNRFGWTKSYFTLILLAMRSKRTTHVKKAQIERFSIIKDANVVR